MTHLPAFGVPIRARGRATPSQPSIITDVAVEYNNEGPTHISDLKCTDVKETDQNPQISKKIKSIFNVVWKFCDDEHLYLEAEEGQRMHSS